MYYKTEGLGAALQSRIDWWCWDEPGYKDCHQRSYASAQQYCQQTAAAGFETMDDCVVATADANDFRLCTCPKIPPGAPPGEGTSTFFSNTAAVLLAAAIAAVGIALIMTRNERAPRKGIAHATS